MTKKEEKKKNNSRRIYENNLFLFKIAFKESPAYIIFKLVAPAKNQVMLFIEHTYLIGFIINAIVLQKPFWHVLVFVGAVFLFVVLEGNVFNALFQNRIEPFVKERIDKRINMELYKKAAEMDLSCYDDPSFFNDFVWAMSEATDRTYKTVDVIGGFIGQIIGLSVIGGYILAQDRLGVIIIAVSSIGVFFVSKTINKLNLAMREKLRPSERKYGYIGRILYLPEYAKELRLNNVKPTLYKQYEEAISEWRGLAKKHSKKLAVYDFLQKYVFNTLMIQGAYLFFLLYRSIVKNAFPYGTMVVLYNSCGRLRNTLYEILYIFPMFQENSLYIEKIRHFLDYKGEVKSPENPLPMANSDDLTLELKNVSFAYNDSLVLKNINMTVKKGEKIALVGYNGAGKTTLIKLLMRLYDPTSGEILYCGNDIKNYDLNEYRKTFQTIFQDYQLFATTIAENIVMDVTPINKAQATEAAEKGGFADKLAEYKNSYNTQVSREFDQEGVLLSGGEAQRLAITRALYHNSPILILDEPSSALDPAGEYNLNKTMLEISASKTVFIISHRLSTTMLADKIYMLENGEIAESGTHDELMALNGKYAYMFNLQAEKYRAEVL